MSKQILAAVKHNVVDNCVFQHDSVRCIGTTIILSCGSQKPRVEPSLILRFRESCKSMGM